MKKVGQRKDLKLCFGMMLGCLRSDFPGEDFFDEILQEALGEVTQR
ncbi:MAG: hypothetical protein F6K19_00905 [Cyanothece sp. SIO1E1]|nr:hypothetical protein [Cyanothece sp. SIO1E1]